jgi:hypothetical protein
LFVSLKSANLQKINLMPITCTTVPIDADSTGDRWHITDETELARLVGLVARCEFGHVETILNGDTADAIVYDAAQQAEIRQKAINALTIKTDTTGKEEGGPAKYHRDGFLFEAISWIAARKSASPEALLRDPHIGATTQGLDGLMIELNATKDDITATTVFEDKCTENARHTFAYVTMPALRAHHVSSRKILESATTLLRQEFKAGTVNAMAAKAISMNVRKYRSSLTILPSEDSQSERERVFKGYNDLAGLNQAGRLGCTLLTGNDIRDWFESFNQKVINSL